MSSTDLHTATRAFARVLGPFVAIVSGEAAAHSAEIDTLASDFAGTPTWVWAFSPFVLLGGLVVVALHPYWHGPAAVAVSALGWLVVVRGLLMLVFPATFVSMSRAVVDHGGLWRGACLAFAAIGLFLAYVGWMPAADRLATRGMAADRDQPRPA